jgi:3-oxoacyl-[acyl-carrier protein] reductase
VRLDGKVAVITGGGQGIGRAICRELVAGGAAVVVVDLNLGAAQAAVEEAVQQGGRGFAVAADVTDTQQVEAAFKAAIEHFGGIDVLVNNAGGSARSAMSSFAESVRETWETVIDRNLIGTMNCTRAIVNHLMTRPGSKIVNIGSGTGVSGSPKQVDYSAAKAGVIGFTKALAKELGEFDINVNTVSPGLIWSEGLADVPKATVEANLARQALKRYGQPEDIAKAVAFLASDDAGFITGQNLVVCGGGRIS